MSTTQERDSRLQLLVVAESAPSSTQGFGVTLETLVRNWPPDRILSFHRVLAFHSDPDSPFKSIHAPLPGRSFTHAISYFLGKRPGWMGRYSRSWLDKHMNGWTPDLIYGFYFHASIPRYVKWVSQQLGCPYVLHVGDDTNRSLRNAHDLPPIYQQAAGCIAISEEMAQEYEQRYDTRFDVLHNGAADELFVDEISHHNGNSKFTLRYVGSLLRAQHWNAIEDIVAAVKTLNRQGVSAQFEIYCDEWTKDLAISLSDDTSVFYKGFAKKPKNFQLLQSADLLVLPASFSDSEGFYRFSMPTKLSEYLASGTPTLVYGPRGMAATEFCIRHTLAVVESRRSVERLVTLVKEMMQARGQYRAQAASDRAFAKKHLSASAMRQRFHVYLKAAHRKTQNEL